MKIAIVGTGNVGGALATQWSKSSHQIFLGVKDQKRFKGQLLLDNPHTSVHPIYEAVQQAEVVLVATPPQIALDLVTEFGPVEGKVIIDATNAINRKPEPYLTAYHAFDVMTKADVVKCFNSTGFENMANPIYQQQRLDMFMAGDSKKAKKIANQLAIDAGFEICHDFGNGDKVVLLEQFALAWINLAIFQGMGRNIGFKLLKR